MLSVTYCIGQNNGINTNHMEVCHVSFRALGHLSFSTPLFHREHVNSSARSKGLAALRAGSHVEKLIGIPSQPKTAGKMYLSSDFLQIYNQLLKKSQKKVNLEQRESR